MFIRERRIVIMKDTMTALSGTFHPGRTWEDSSAMIMEWMVRNSVGLTWARKLENGRPESRAKANIWRDAVATFVMQPHAVNTMVIVVKAVAPAGDFVAIRNVWTNGITLGSERMVLTSPMQKQKLISITNPREPLMTIVHIMARVSVIEASCISSDIYCC